jgi:hypothetical protein
MKVELEPTETVEPCPMCGGEVSLHSSPVGAFQPKKGAAIVPSGTLFWCRCDDSGAVTCGTTQAAVSDRANALVRWNRRA